MIGSEDHKVYIWNMVNEKISEVLNNHAGIFINIEYNFGMVMS